MRVTPSFPLRPDPPKKRNHPKMPGFEFRYRNAARTAVPIPLPGADGTFRYLAQELPEQTVPIPVFPAVGTFRYLFLPGAGTLYTLYINTLCVNVHRKHSSTSTSIVVGKASGSSRWSRWLPQALKLAESGGKWVVIMSEGL